LRRLFLRVYLALGAVLLASVAVVLVLTPPVEEVELDRQILGMTGVWPDDVAARFGSGVDQEAVAKAMEQELGHPVAVLPEEAVVGSVGGFARRNLAQGDPVVQLHDAGPAIYVPIPGRPFVAVLRPGPPAPPWTGRRGALLAALLLAGIGLAVYGVVRPVERQLTGISGTAARIGQGELGARADVRRHDAAGQLADTFNEMAERVQTMVEGRRALLHGVSHELRTPLARLRFAVELLEGADEPEARARRVDEMLGDVGELETLVAELMRYSELEEGAGLDKQPTDLVKLVGGLVEEARRLRPDAELVWQPRELPELELDRRLVTRSVGNLVNNAVRYSEARVRVSTVREFGSVRVVVEDDGPGVPEADRDRIFRPFVRLDAARSRDTGGIGLGLALAQRAARAHKGRIVVDESPLGGARFSWSVPTGEERRSGAFARLTGSFRGGGGKLTPG
jgi:signal transduction histidine kinase